MSERRHEHKCPCCGVQIDCNLICCSSCNVMEAMLKTHDQRGAEMRRAFGPPSSTPTGAATTGEGEMDDFDSSAALGARMLRDMDHWAGGPATIMDPHGMKESIKAYGSGVRLLLSRLAAAEQKNTELEAWRGQLERHLARVRDELTAACIAAEGEDGHLLPNVGADSLHSCMWDAAEMCDDFTMTTIRGTISTQLEESDADRPQQDSQQPVRRAAGRGGQSTEDAGELAGPDEAGRGTSLVRRGPADRGVLGRSVLVNLLGKLKECAELYGECHAKGEALAASEFMDRMHECESAILREMAELEARVRELEVESANRLSLALQWEKRWEKSEASLSTAVLQARQQQREEDVKLLSDRGGYVGNWLAAQPLNHPETPEEEEEETTP